MGLNILEHILDYIKQPLDNWISDNLLTLIYSLK